MIFQFIINSNSETLIYNSYTTIIYIYIPIPMYLQISIHDIDLTYTPIYILIILKSQYIHISSYLVL